MKSIEPIQFFSTANFPCSYLAGRIAKNCVIDPDFSMNNQVYAELIRSGFRRSGTQVYRPQCLPCKECISTRIPVHEFSLSRSQKRTVRNNKDLKVVINTAGFKPIYQGLYDLYLEERHNNNESEGIDSFFESQWCNTHYLEFYDHKMLLGVAVIDVLFDEVSAVYTLFDPELGGKRSLGTYAVLWMIEYAKKLDKSYVYPGYWIQNCNKMNYKSRFQPLEGYYDGQWIAIPKGI